MGGLGDIGDAFVFLLWICAVSVPLGLWKLVEIGVWLTHHISIS